MTDQAQPETDHKPFRVVLYPNRSLGPNGFLLLMLFIGGVSFTTGIAFLMMGAWPVFGFFGLDVLLVYIAFKLNYRSGRAFETIEISPDVLTLTQVDSRGRSRSFDFNPYWVRVRLSEWPDGRTKLRLASHGQELEFARMLNDAERKKFADVLEGALTSARMSRLF